MSPLVAHLDPRLAYLAKLKRTPHEKLISTGKPACELGFLLMKLIEFWLGIESVHMPRTTLHEEHDTGLGPWLMHGGFWSQRAIHRALPCEEITHRDSTKRSPKTIEELSTSCRRGSWSGTDRVMHVSSVNV